MSDAALLELLKGAGANIPLAVICWGLYKENQKKDQQLKDVQDRERDQLLKDRALLNKALDEVGDAR